MKIEKIRGHHRMWRRIERWQSEYAHLDVTAHNRLVAPIAIPPYNGLRITRSGIQYPHGKTRMKITEGLLAIYTAWDAQLQKTHQPCYLALWLYEPNFTRSQVVCAHGEMCNFYRDAFTPAPHPAQKHPARFGLDASTLQHFQWQRCIQSYELDSTMWGTIDEFDSEQEYSAHTRWMTRELAKPHSTVPYTAADGSTVERYIFGTGTIWVGSTRDIF